MLNVKRSAPLNVTLIGFGAIGQSICGRLQGSECIRVTHVVVRPNRVAEVQAALDQLYGSIGAVQAVQDVPADATLVLECAGHEALASHMIPALLHQRPIPEHLPF